MKAWAVGLGILGLLGIGALFTHRRRATLGAPPTPGGRAAGFDPRVFDPAWLWIGTQVEFEHTADHFLAQKIAMDHLVEDPHYYAKLANAGLID